MWNPRLSAEFERNLIRVTARMDLSPCNGCGECALRCAAGVQMSREEVEAVRRFENDSPDRNSIRAVLAQDKTVNLGDGVTVTMCRCFDMTTQRCAVYPVRPLVCRLLGHVEWLPCPIEKVERSVPTPDALALMRSYAAHERKTFEEWDAADAPPAGRTREEPDPAV